MLSVKESVGVPRIELGLSAPKADVLPIYYTPTHSLTPHRRTTDILHPVKDFKPKANVFPISPRAKAIG